MTPDTTATAEEHAPTPVANFDDEHLRPYAKDPGRAEMVVALSLFVGLLGFAAYGALYWVGGQTQLEGVFLGVGLFAFGFGMSAWGKYLLPQGPFSEERHTFASPEPEVRAISAAVTERGKMMFRRRGFLGVLLAAGGAVMSAVIAFPLIRSLGPQPKKSLITTNWKRGSRLVDITGRPILADDLEVGGAMTVFPEGFVGSSVDQTMLIRAATAPLDPPTKPGRGSWTPAGYVAYSKLCTHAGCPVGLYQEATQELVCPCHQSVFKILQGAQQVFGPAPRPLPQLPLMIDSKGYLRAQRGYEEPVGPGFWERS
ncbi:MAG TPA: Rieske 2Fe-2S domain-containing protein [Acidimicrobiales bacterium]|nr:Rieske 2Fe-2S domain-containing protein [Acidimicrobiales bacterium]